MSKPHISEAPGLEQFCLWKFHSWGEVEQELTEMSGTSLATSLPQQADLELLDAQNQMLQPYLPAVALSHQYPFDWEATYLEPGPEPTYYTPIPNVAPNNPFFTYYFWLGGSIDPFNIPGRSEYLPVTVSGDMKLTDVFDTYFSVVDADVQLEFCNIMQVVFRDGEPRQGTQNYYQGAKCTGITVRETQWYGWRGFWLVGCDRERAFREACEKAKTRELL